jgi:hypothetical protein
MDCVGQYLIARRAFVNITYIWLKPFLPNQRYIYHELLQESIIITTTTATIESYLYVPYFPV